MQRETSASLIKTYSRAATRSPIKPSWFSLNASFSISALPLQCHGERTLIKNFSSYLTLQGGKNVKMPFKDVRDIIKVWKLLQPHWPSSLEETFTAPGVNREAKCNDIYPTHLATRADYSQFRGRMVKSVWGDDQSLILKCVQTLNHSVTDCNKHYGL